MDIIKIIAVILAVFLHHGNGRAITATNKDNIERPLGLAEEESNTVLNERNENPNEREENPADVHRLSEPDSSSHTAEQSQFSDIRGESANKSSDSAMLPMEANPVWKRHKRSVADEPECYTGRRKTVHLTHTGRTIHYPVCRKVARFTACSSSMANNNNKRKCKPSNYVAYPLDNVAYPKTCSCAP